MDLISYKLGYIGSDSFLKKVGEAMKEMKAKNPNLIYRKSHIVCNWHLLRLSHMFHVCNVYINKFNGSIELRNI